MYGIKSSSTYECNCHTKHSTNFCYLDELFQGAEVCRFSMTLCSCCVVWLVVFVKVLLGRQMSCLVIRITHCTDLSQV